MPRHPPCALHSLSHKHSTRNTTTKKLQLTHKTKNNPTNHTPHHQRCACAAGQGHLDLSYCYKMLASTIHKPNPPTGANPPRRPTRSRRYQAQNPTHPPSKEDEHQLRQQRHLIPQTPNSVPTTHQTVPHPGSTPTHPPHTTAGQTSGSTEDTNRTDRQRTSTIPLVNTTMRHQTLVGDRGVCSLERR